MHHAVLAVRQLRKNPGFAAVAIVTMALGIGANSAIFSVVNGVVLKPLGYPHPERLMYVTSQFPGIGFDQFWLDPVEYAEFRQRTRAFSSVGGFTVRAANVGTPDQPRRVATALVTGDMFRTLGVPPLVGRGLGQPDTLPKAPAVAVLSWELWQRAFAADRTLVGRTVLVDGEATTIVGIMPRGFDLHDAKVELWLPLTMDPANPGNRGNHYLYLVGRLADGQSLPSARAELETLLAQWPSVAPDKHTPNTRTHRLRIDGLQDDIVGKTKRALIVLQAAVVFVLLIACANLANLLLARAESRHKEFAVRTALGANRRELARQFIVEGLVISAAGAVVGLVLGNAGLRLLLSTSPDSLPRTADIGLDLIVVAFTVGLAVLTGLVFGLAPLLQFDESVSETLKEGGTRSTSSVGRHRVRRALVVAEVSLAVVLVVGAGLMLRSFWNLAQVDLGFPRASLTTFSLVPPPPSYPKPEDTRAFYRRLLEQLAAMPGIEAVTAMSGLPPQREVDANDTQFEGVAMDPGRPIQNVDYYQATTVGYLDTMRIPLVAGRGFVASDVDGAPVVLVNEALANRFYPGESPLGRRLRPGFSPKTPWLTIVGIVKDVKQGGVDQKVGTELYFLADQMPAAIQYFPRELNIVVRSAMPAATLNQQLRDAVRRVDASLPVVKLRSMDDVFSEAVARPRFLTWLLATFALVALALAAVGTYGVLAYVVSERRREIGIRMALGADRRAVLGMVLAQGLALAAIGLAIGLAGAFALTRLMASMLFGVQPGDPTTMAAVAACIVLVAAAACLVPARRATRVDPLVVLRQE